MFRKKISIFVCSFLCLMLFTNLFALPVFGEDYPYTEDGEPVTGGQLIYLVAQANGIKLTSDNPKSTYDVLLDSYDYYKSYTKGLASDLIGYVKKGIDGYLSVGSAVYNSICTFLRGYLYPNGYLTTGFVPKTSRGGQFNTYDSLDFLFDFDKHQLSSIRKGRIMWGWGSGNSPYSCKTGCYFDKPVYVFIYKFSTGQPVFTLASLKPVSVNFHYTSSDLPVKSNYDVTHKVFYKDFECYIGGSYSTYDPVFDNNTYVINPFSDSNKNLIPFLLSLGRYDLPTVSYSPTFNEYNINNSITNVTITNIYYNTTTNNITINNNGTQQPIDDNIKSDVIAPTVPNIKPENTVTTLNDIDTINKYHNDMDLQVNDFLIQFNDNLNKIDTNCYSLTSCAINGLKSVGSAVNDITGYSDKGMNSDFVLLICLFLLLGILFTIL